MISANEAGQQTKLVRSGMYKDELLNKFLTHVEGQIKEAVALGQTKTVCFLLYYYRKDMSKLGITRLRDLGYKVIVHEGFDSTCIVDWSEHAR
jgi:hypothetical protein